MLQRWIAHGVASDLPTIHVVSDSTGTTAKAVARAALASFDETNSYLEVLPGIKTPRELTEELSAHLEHHREKHIPGAFLIFYTLVDEQLREAMDDFVEQASADIEEAKRTQGEESATPNRIIAVDVLDKAHSALADATGRMPEPHPGALYSVDDAYFRPSISRSITTTDAILKTSRKRISCSSVFRALRRRRCRSIFRNSVSK